MTALLTHRTRTSSPPPLPPGTLQSRFDEVRSTTEALAEPLAAEDQVVQSMPDVSPTKWHRAHTTWFFETFLLLGFDPGYRVVDPAYDFLFNSYYEQVGPRHPRAERGLISRPDVAEVAHYRSLVDDAVRSLIADDGDSGSWPAMAGVIELGLHHEQQHQELLLMDIKHVLSCNPTDPAYLEPRPALPATMAPPSRWVEVEVQDDLAEVGHDPVDGFCYDNELPRHRDLVPPFCLADRLVSCGDWLAFMDDGGYQRPELWLSDGWIAVQEKSWTAPMYWDRDGDRWSVFTLHGRRPVDEAEPVCHVSFLEADAFARWADARLPSEAEWEVAAVAHDGLDAPNDLSTGALHPRRPELVAGLGQLHGDVWEWTASPYRPYPGFTPAPGAIGEYNGKFMCNQMALRGGACVTPSGHSRPTYRNFFPPAARWAFSGLRLAQDAS